MFFTRPRINIREWDGLLSDIGYDVRDLANPNRFLPDKTLEEHLPVTEPDLARRILENLSRKLPSDHPVEDLKIVSENILLSMGLKTTWFTKEKPIINFYRFLMANKLINSILKKVDDPSSRNNINLLRNIARKIPNEIFTVVLDLLETSPREHHIDRLLHGLIEDDPKLHNQFIDFVIDNFENHSPSMQKKLIYHLNISKQLPFEGILKRARYSDHSKPNVLSHITAELLDVENSSQSSFDDIKEFLSEKLFLMDFCLLKTKILSELLKYGHNSKNNEEILHTISKYSFMSTNYQVCQQLLNRQREGIGFVTEQMPIVVKGKQKPSFTHLKNLRSIDPPRSLKKLKSSRNYSSNSN